jgi:hypothetical protein
VEQELVAFVICGEISVQYTKELFALVCGEIRVQYTKELSVCSVERLVYSTQRN